MEPTDDLDKVQKELDRLGVRDIKIFFSENANKIVKSDLYKQVAIMLSSYLAGNKTPLKPIGDKLLKRKPDDQ